MSETSAVVNLETALLAVLYEAKAKGADIDVICDAAKSGLFESTKPYRHASHSVVIPASDAIDKALREVTESWRRRNTD